MNSATPVINIITYTFLGDKKVFPLPVYSEPPTGIPQKCLSQNFKINSVGNNIATLSREDKDGNQLIEKVDVTSACKSDSNIYFYIILTDIRFDLGVYCDRNHFGRFLLSDNFSNIS